MQGRPEMRILVFVLAVGCTGDAEKDTTTTPTTTDTDTCETLPGTCGNLATGDTGCPEGYSCWGPSAFVCYRGDCDLPICLPPTTRIWTPSGERPLRDLRRGDPVWTLHGWAEIALTETVWEATPVYSLAVDEEKTFLAGKSAAWVHNCFCDGVEGLVGDSPWPGLSIRGPTTIPRTTHNRFRGFWGESWAKERIALLADRNVIQVVGEQVRVRTPGQGLGTYRVLDYLVRTEVNLPGLPKGSLVAIEVKAGNAVRSAMQRLKDLDLLNDPATTWMNRKRVPRFDDGSGGKVFLNYGLPTGPIHTLVLRVPESAMPKSPSLGGNVPPL